MKTKIIIMLACLGVILFLPKMTLADISLDDFDFDVDVSDDGWNINVGSDDSGGGGGLSGDSYGLPKGSILGIVDNILMWMLGILSAVALIGFIISGIMYLTAGRRDASGQSQKSNVIFHYRRDCGTVRFCNLSSGDVYVKWTIILV